MNFVLDKDFFLRIFLLLAVVILVMYAGDVFAQDDPPDGGVGGEDGVNNTTLSKQICKIRKLFCGSTGLVIVGTAVFVVGILMFTGKMTWQTALIMSAGAVVFNNVEFVAAYLAPSQLISGGANQLLEGQIPFEISCICLPWDDFQGIIDAISGN